MLLRVSPRGGRPAARAHVSIASLRGAGRVARRTAVPHDAEAGAGIRVGAREDDDVSGSTPPGEPSLGEAPPDKESPGEACGYGCIDFIRTCVFKSVVFMDV